MHAVDIAGRADVAAIESSDTVPQTFVGPNLNRRGLLIYNGADEDLYLKYGESATTALYTSIVSPGMLWEMPRPIYVGTVSGIWSAGSGGVTGSAMVTQLT